MACPTAHLMQTSWRSATRAKDSSSVGGGRRDVIAAQCRKILPNELADLVDRFLTAEKVRLLIQKPADHPDHAPVDDIGFAGDGRPVHAREVLLQPHLCGVTY